MHVGKKIKEKLKLSNLTNKEFAAKISKHPKYLYQLFKQQHINTELLEQIAEVLGVDLVYFLSDTDEVPNRVDEPLENYKTNYRDKYVQALERENELLRTENNRLNGGGNKQKANVG